MKKSRNFSHGLTAGFRGPLRLCYAWYYKCFGFSDSLTKVRNYYVNWDLIM